MDRSSATHERGPAEAAAEVAEFGSAVLRQVWPLDQLAPIRGAIARFVAKRQFRLANGYAGPREAEFTRHGVGVFEWMTYDKLIEPAALATLFRGSFYNRICEIVFEDGELYVAPGRVGFRYQSAVAPDLSLVPWHQDSYGQDPRVARVMNCWIPLDPGCGVSAPGLEVCRHPGRPGFPLRGAHDGPANAHYDPLAIDRARIVEEYGENFVAPAFDVGDGLAFSENVIHRTYFKPEMTHPRLNLELRVFSLKHLRKGASLEEVRSSSYRVA